MSKKDGLVDVVDSDLRALLFWACIGMSQSRGGAYGNELEHIINNYADHLKFQLPYEPKFNSATFFMHLMDEKPAYFHSGKGSIYFMESNHTKHGNWLSRSREDIMRERNIDITTDESKGAERPDPVTYDYLKVRI